MKIIDLTSDYKKTYLVCFEDWSEEMQEAGDHKCRWYEEMKDKGLGVKIAVDDDGNAYGMIQYVPIEYSPANGENLYFIDCIWVHGHEKGIGNQQKKGTGKALLAAAEADVKSRGADGLVAWGLFMPMWMRASWFRKHGYKSVDRKGISVLLWKQFRDGAKAPMWIKERKHPLADENPGKVTVVAFYNSRCQVPTIMLERSRRAAAAFKDDVVYRSVNTFNRMEFLEWGITDGLYVEGKNIANGPPLAYEKIYKKIETKVRRLKKRKER